MIRLSWLVGAFLAGAVLQTALAERPRVVQTVPDNGAKAVDPGLQELRVVFDQSMSSNGWSVVGGGISFPKLIGKGRWVDDRTLVWTCRLQPEHEYWLSINSDRFTNFRGRNGESCVPYPISFTTGPRPAGAESDTPDNRLTPGLNREALANLRRAIDEDYSYRDLRRVDWKARFAEFEPRLETASTPDQFAERAAQLLAPAGDVHLWLQVEDNRLPTFRRQSAWNVASSTLPKRVPGWERRSPIVFTGKFEDGIRYLCIRGWPGDNAGQLKPAFDELAAAAKDKCPLIIDVRANGGGSEDAAQRLAGCFLDRKVTYARHITRRGGRFGKPMDRVLEPNPDGPRYRGRVALLIGLGTVSSCESFAMMMKQIPDCTLIGEPTAGCSGNPHPVDLGNGITAFIPSWKDLRLDGTCLEGEGFAPDITVKTVPADFESKDPVLETALRVLREPPVIK